VLENPRRAAPSGASGSAQRILAQPLRFSALLLLAATAQAPNPDAARQQMQDAERARDAERAHQKDAAQRAAAAAAEERRLAAQRVAAAQRLRQSEAATEAVATRIESLARQRAEAEARLRQQAEAMEPLLPLIERMSLYPTETLLAVPAAPEDTLRGVLVLAGLSHQLESDAEALRRQQASLDAATAALQAAAPQLAAAEAAQADQAADLDRQIAAAQADRRAAADEATEAAKHAAEQASRADSLRDAIAQLEAQRRAAEAQAQKEAAQAERQKQAAAAAAARTRQEALARPTGAGTIPSAARPGGQLTAPVAGTIVRAWGEATEAGPATGISYQAAPNARVVSPCGGRVVFAQPFRSYGNLLIIDCGGGYHAVLAGLARLDIVVGRSVAIGEPVGVMPGWDPAAGGKRPSLYVELRRDGQPVDPAPWLKARA
jgi:septal ring factor EnvC (AmiA/AmiB activator)